MKRMAYGMLMMLLGATAAFAERNMAEDSSAEGALLTWSDPSAWQVGLVYAHLSRQVELEGVEWELRGQTVDAAIGFAPWPWILLYGQAGGSQARVAEAMRENTAVGAGGLLGARVNLWQIYEGVQRTSWRVTLGVAGQYAYRTGADDGEGDIQWSETLVMLPLDYHLTFARSFRNFYMAEFQSLGVYAGPAFSKVDGTWTRGNMEKDFEEVQSYGVVGGVELWLLENLSFGARADWFDGTTLQLTLRYRF
jgi:hypothetical protein